MEPMIAPAGWCAPSETVYSFYDPYAAPAQTHCPEWNGPEQDACESRDVDGDIYWKSWHSCKDEFTGPHAICVCEDCGAERIILRESTTREEVAS